MAAINEIAETENSPKNFNFELVDLDPFELADEVKQSNS